MNERFYELKREADKQVKELLTDPNFKRVSTYEDMVDTKFAELIVQECSAVANHFSDGHEVRQFDDSKRYLYFVDVGEVMLEHFGVK